MRFLICVTTILLVVSVGQAGELTREQRLIVACHRLDAEGVVAVLRDGADVNERFGDGDAMLFQDPWSLGWPSAARKWTPLIALADASKFPDPPRAIKNSSVDRKWALEQQAKVPPEQIQQRKRDELQIALILLSHRADIDADDGYGATALDTAISSKKLELAKLLLRFQAKVNTKTRVYIDGPGDITPLHHAYWSAELTKLLLEKGADPHAKDTDGKTPRDWARMSDDPTVARIYQSAK